MPRLKSISLQLRFLLLGLTLLSVLSLDKREVAIRLKKPLTEHTLKASEKQLVVKEKVSFEAVASYLVLPAAILPEALYFNAPFIQAPVSTVSYAVPVVIPLCQRLLAMAISPNAP
ncbi:hypothetical protein [Adhaeribacter soli]|uniref:Uncharacterized protein n=1 Tax=Adhaeribacter soli TaxID=2607655 RepID=A0A5N1IV73_9BACT|nr:hypothetical protein [Adhaeribacter soli]KAA9333667.1 hypothetical protein F0P94_10485 [Adhaeribacter soli]